MRNFRNARPVTTRLPAPPRASTTRSAPRLAVTETSGIQGRRTSGFKKLSHQKSILPRNRKR
ncbi:MAG: hypothetical protein Q8J97_05995, partial [Flavobacteriaceae bacterium]|nr:hypothetical protein [Flavobacteriaceae bacterium]